MSDSTEPVPKKGFLVTTLLIVKDIARARKFYEDVFGAELVEDDEPVVLRLANTWLLINRGGGPTDDKPTVTAAPPADQDRLSIALNLRVADIHECCRSNDVADAKRSYVRRRTCSALSD
jgi:lactoylglutathione lyase